MKLTLTLDKSSMPTDKFEVRRETLKTMAFDLETTESTETTITYKRPPENLNDLIDLSSLPLTDIAKVAQNGGKELSPQIKIFINNGYYFYQADLGINLGPSKEYEFVDAELVYKLLSDVLVFNIFPQTTYDDVEKVIVKRLSEAKDSIKCSLYGITNKRITETLINKKSEGLEVILCLDKTQSAGKHSTHKELENAGIEIVIKKTGTLEHNKFCVIDDKRVIMGSWNFSESAQKQDNSQVDISGCHDVVKKFSAAFERIYKRDTE